MVYFLLWWRGNASLFFCEEVEVVFFFCYFPIGQGFVVKEHNITSELFEITFPGYYKLCLPVLQVCFYGKMESLPVLKCQELKLVFLMSTNHSHGYSFDLIVSPDF